MMDIGHVASDVALLYRPTKNVHVYEGFIIVMDEVNCTRKKFQHNHIVIIDDACL